MQKMHEDDPDWDQEAAAAEIQEGAEAAGMAAIAEMTGIGGAMDLSVANGSKSMAFMGFFSQAVSKFKEGGTYSTFSTSNLLRPLHYDSSL